MASKQKTIKANKKSKAWFDKAFEGIVTDQPKQSFEEDDFIELPDSKPAKKFQGVQESSVIYVGHLPFGFDEYQVNDFFKQFGTVKHAEIARSSKTGRSKGYAFVQFSNSTVAQIAAETMNDYLMFKKRLIVKLVPLRQASKFRWNNEVPISDEGLESLNEKINSKGLFKVQAKHALAYNSSDKTENLEDFMNLQKKKNKELKKAGIDYEFNDYKTLAQVRKMQEVANGKMDVDDNIAIKDKKRNEWR